MKIKRVIFVFTLIAILCVGLWGFSGSISNLFSESDKDVDGGDKDTGETKFARRSVESVKVNQILLLTDRVELASK